MRIFDLGLMKHQGFVWRFRFRTLNAYSSGVATYLSTLSEQKFIAVTLNLMVLQVMSQRCFHRTS